MKTIKVSVSLSKEAQLKFDSICIELTTYYNSALNYLLPNTSTAFPFQQHLLSSYLTSYRNKEALAVRRYYEKVSHFLMSAIKKYKYKVNKYLPKLKTIRFNSLSGYKENIRATEKGYKISSLGEIVQIKNKTKKLSEYVKSIKEFTLKKTSFGTFELHLRIQEDKSEKVKNYSEYIGIDVGIKNIATTSNGDFINYPDNILREEESLKILLLKIKNSQKDSNNQKEYIKKFLKLKKRLKDIKAIYLKNIFEKIIPEKAIVAIESLDIKSLINKNNKNLSNKIVLAGWQRLFSVVRTIVSKKEGHVIEVPRFFPSSKKCSCCNHVISKLPLSARTFSCPKCNSSIDRDLNAAINLKNYAKNKIENEKMGKSKKICKNK